MLMTYRGDVGFGRWAHRHPFAVDVALAVGFVLLDTVVTLIGGEWWPVHPGPLAWVMLALQAVACASLAFRRRAWLTVVTILGVFSLALTLLIYPAGLLIPASHWNVWMPYSTTLAAYAPITSCARTRTSRRTAFVAVGLLTLIAARPWQPSIAIIAIALMRIPLGPLLGLYFDARRRLVQALTERAERAERERHLLAERARTEERARLAGEMHDVVTHRVSLMVLQAGALRMTATDAATQQAAEDLRANGCQALDELRDLVGILRTEPDGDESPATAGLATLVAESTAVGTPAELVEDGDPVLASPVVGRTAYRVVREALTNVRKHAPGARVTVHVEYAESGVRLTVRNAPPDAVPTGMPAAGAVPAADAVPAGTPAAGAVAGGAPAANGQAGGAGGALAGPANGAGGALAGGPVNGAANGLAGELAGTGSGIGIAGLRQRIELVHGTLRAGREPDGGFCVEATLPAYVPTADSVV
jgi:signal transduction histidine kinase